MRSVYLSPLLLIWLLMLPRAALAFAVDIWPGGEFSGQPLRQQWQEPAAATKPLTLCALYPHLRDAYWLSVNQGMVEEATRLGVSLRIHEAGGYGALAEQRQQLQLWIIVLAKQQNHIPRLIWKSRSHWIMIRSH